MLSRHTSEAGYLPGQGSEGSFAETLPDILKVSVNLAVRHRDRREIVVAGPWLSQVDDIADVFETSTLPASLGPRLVEAGYTEADAAALTADIVDLAATFTDIMDTDRVAIRLEVVETDACRRFHADYVTARLICTYVGPGTQWLDTRDAAALAAGADPQTLTIRQIGTGDVAIFKGRLWSPDAPAVHRSPPIAGTGARRLMLVMDPAPPAPIAHA